MGHLPKRKLMRLKNYDYSSPGYYFLTLCTLDKKPYLGHVKDGLMELNSFGQIVDQCIAKIEGIYHGVEIDCKIIMPNHVHMLIHHVGVADPATRHSGKLSMMQRSKMLIPKIVQQFKTATIKMTKQFGELKWQRGYYEHIIRNEKAYQKIYEYIETNPFKWELDEYYLRK